MAHAHTCLGCETPDLAFTPHDHAHCSADALARAEAVVAQRGVKMTPVRRRVLEILLESHKALGAYDVLTRLAAEGFGNQPPVAYRALEFLEDQGLAHRIRRLNSFCLCKKDDPCRHCFFRHRRRNFFRRCLVYVFRLTKFLFLLFCLDKFHQGMFPLHGSILFQEDQ